MSLSIILLLTFHQLFMNLHEVFEVGIEVVMRYENKDEDEEGMCSFPIEVPTV